MFTYFPSHSITTKSPFLIDSVDGSRAPLDSRLAVSIMALDRESAGVGTGGLWLLTVECIVFVSPYSEPPSSDCCAAALTAFQLNRRTYIAELRMEGTAS